jgi:hypothetical protein
VRGGWSSFERFGRYVSFCIRLAYVRLGDITGDLDTLYN